MASRAPGITSIAKTGVSASFEQLGIGSVDAIHAEADEPDDDAGVLLGGAEKAEHRLRLPRRWRHGTHAHAAGADARATSGCAPTLAPTPSG
jgi:hypothetical protein